MIVADDLIAGLRACLLLERCGFVVHGPAADVGEAGTILRHRRIDLACIFGGASDPDTIAFVRQISAKGVAVIGARDSRSQRPSPGNSSRRENLALRDRNTPRIAV